MADFDKFSEKVKDVIKEISNIGAGNAVTALAKMLKTRVDMKVPNIKIIDFDKVTDILGDPSQPVVGMFISLKGDIEGSMMYLIEIENAENIVKILFKDINMEFKEFDNIAISALKEVTNIIVNAYVTALVNLTNLNINTGIPSLAIDMAGSILSVPVIQYAQDSDKVIYIESLLGDRNKSLLGHIFLVPNIDSYDVLLNSLGVNINE